MDHQGRTPARVSALATRQHGVVSAHQLRSLGHSKKLVMRECERGRFHILHRGVYAVGHRRLSWHSHCWAGISGAEANETDEVVWPAVASHGSAAYLWGIYRYAPETIDVTAPIRRRAKRAFRVHFSSILEEEDREKREGIPVTSLPRTLLDLAIRSRPEQLDRLLERAEDWISLTSLPSKRSSTAPAGTAGEGGSVMRSRSTGRTPPLPAPALRSSSGASSAPPASPTPR
jgi:hypothetical protein